MSQVLGRVSFVQRDIIAPVFFMGAFMLSTATHSLLLLGASEADYTPAALQVDRGLQSISCRFSSPSESVAAEPEPPAPLASFEKAALIENTRGDDNTINMKSVEDSTVFDLETMPLEPVEEYTEVSDEPLEVTEIEEILEDQFPEAVTEVFKDIEPDQSEVPVDSEPMTEMDDSEQSLSSLDKQEVSSQLFISPSVISNPAPRYPRLAQRRGMEGALRLAISVDEEGFPTHVEVIDSSGYTILDQCAQKTVKTRWRFSPARSQGEAVESKLVVAVSFNLENS